jgi:hypothetical protein
LLEQRLDKNLSKSLKSYLNIKLSNLTISEQYDHLKSFRLMPFRLRFFQNLVFFLFSLIKSQLNSVLPQFIHSLKKKEELQDPTLISHYSKLSYINFLLPEDPAYSTPDGSNCFFISRRYVWDTQTCAASHKVKSSQSHDFDFFEKKQKSQSHDFDFFQKTKKVKVMTLTLT